MANRHSYTPEQLQYLRDMYPKLSRAELTVAFNEHFGLSLTKQKIAAAMKNHNITSGRDGRFKPGRTYRVPAGAQKANRTSFKKGRKPHNWLPVGSEKVADGYLYVKTEEPNIWCSKSKLIWEEVNGEIPKGHIIQFIDGDPLNCTLENMELISRRESLALNRLGYKSAPEELKPVLRKIALIRIKRSERAA